VAGLLYRRLRASGGLAALDPADAEALERRHAGQVARSAVQWPEIDRVLTALQAAGIPFRLLKGAALALTVYEEPSDRTDLCLTAHSDFSLSFNHSKRFGWRQLHFRTDDNYTSARERGV
jgi:hypothetical protein